METEVKLTKLAQCAGCGAKVGAGTLAKLLDGIPTRSDERLLVGFDKSDDASVYKIDENNVFVGEKDKYLSFLKQYKNTLNINHDNLLSEEINETIKYYEFKID